MKLTVARGWDNGRQRDMNEDSYLLWQFGSPAELNGAVLPLGEAPAPEGAEAPTGIFLIADGIGGAAAGEVASKLALETFAESAAQQIALPQNGTSHKPDWMNLVKQAVKQADDAVRNKRNASNNDMGTTLVGALLAGATAYVFNVGDSRAYRITPTEIVRITHDHSYVQFLVDSGQIRAEDVRTHPQRNIILRSLGDEHKGAVDIFPTALAWGDTLLLGSDGLWEMIEDTEMQGIVNAAPDLDQAAKMLVQAANENGGADNISVILIRLS